MLPPNDNATGGTITLGQHYRFDLIGDTAVAVALFLGKWAQLQGAGRLTEPLLPQTLCAKLGQRDEAVAPLEDIEHPVELLLATGPSGARASLLAVPVAGLL